MITVTVSEKYCKGCGLCVTACPKRIMKISGSMNSNGQYLAYCAEPASCVGCKSCGIICPDDAITIERED